MAVFDPKDWFPQRDWITWLRGRNQRRHGQTNRVVLQRWLMTVAFCICFASLGPAHLILVIVPGLLIIAAFASAILAALRGEFPLSPHLTGWDEGAFSLVLGVGLNLLLRGPPTSP